MSNPSVFEYVQEQLQLSKGSWGAVAEGSGVSRRTIEKIASGDIVDPGVMKIEMLAQFFRRQKAAAVSSRASA